ncbi:hypothetical protein GH714_024556 [Hevea brasiliensis]|uniref:Uncharacterized protein n=1 Tax=Hevea brasiliensis TaxID=3981 RepID=A0A6A6LGD5_HEVBR|nr:hypothetical protein GH714_024556 [Hevea brasiliensis]
MKLFSPSVIAAVVVVILLSTSPCRASVPKGTDGNHFSIGDSNMEFEFMMDSEFSRMLSTSTVYTDTFKKGAVFGCGRAKRYCLPQPNPKRRRSPSKYRHIQLELMDITALERDLGLHPLMREFPVNQSNEIRRAYLKAGPYQPKLSEYPFSGSDNRHH